jgi:hypothetical protein
MRKLTRGHVLDETGEEGLFLEVGVVLLEVSLAGRDELHGGELEAAALEARDDLTDETCVRAKVFSLLGLGAVERVEMGCSPRWTPSGLRGESPGSEGAMHQSADSSALT